MIKNANLPPIGLGFDKLETLQIMIKILVGLKRFKPREDHTHDV